MRAPLTRALLALSALCLLAPQALAQSEPIGIQAKNLAAKAQAAASSALVKPTDALATIKTLMSQGQNAGLQIWTDSIGNEYNPAPGSDSARREWPYLLADKFAAAYRNYTVQVIYWPLTSATAYTPLPAMVIQTGTGGSPPVLTIYNFAVAGSPTMYGMGSSWQAALVAPNVDAVLISHGANHVYVDGTGTAIAGGEPMIRGEIAAAVEQYKLFRPGVPIDLVLENPRRDDNGMAPVNAAWRRYAYQRDVGLVDVYGAFMAAGKPASWYQSTGVQSNDNVHPDQLGETVYASVIWTAYQAAPLRFPSPQRSLLLPGSPDTNLLTNGNFAKYTTTPGPPDNWTAGGTGTITATRDTTIVADNRQGYSVKLLSTGGSSYIQQTINSTTRAYLAGQVVTLVVKRYSAETSASTAGRVELYVSSTANGVTLYDSRPFITRADGWMYIVLAGVPVPADCNSLAVRLYHDNEATPTTNPVYYDQAWLGTGYMPTAAR